MNETLRRRLSNQLRRGDAVLFTGAGFSRGALTANGDSIASAEDLRRALWQVAFPGQDLDTVSSLGDVFGVSVRQGANRVGEILRESLTVDPNSLPDGYRVWYSMPWSRIYTLNIDDLDAAVARRFDLPRRIVPVSAFSSDAMTTETDLQSIHLNGSLDDIPDVTFSFRQYAERTAVPDFWYMNLVRQMVGQAVVFVGTTLDEPPLWQHIELRGRRGQRMRELRPGSYLISPSLPAARRAMLTEFNIDWVEMSADEFAADVLAGMADEQAEGLRALTRRGAPQRGRELLERVGELRLQPAEDLRDFLLGREPEWADFG
jgi:hypothetical protein